MKKRLLACALALVMALGMLSGSVLAADYGFSDVSASDWYYDAVCFVADSGLMDGTGNGFEPERTISRAMLWTVLARVDGQNAKRSTAPDWYAAAQLWAVRKDISDGSDPNGTLTREQLAAMLYRYAQRKGLVRVSPCAELEVFSDAADVSAYAREAMQWAVETGVISGMDGRLSPKSGATRAQVAQILYRLCRTWNLPAQDDASLLLPALLPTEALSQHEHSWEDPTENRNGTHAFTCECGETKTEYCSFEQVNGIWTCGVCGFAIPEGEAIENWNDLKGAIDDEKTELFLVADIAVEDTLSITADTTIYGCGHTLTIVDDNFTEKTLFDNKTSQADLTLDHIVIDGENKERKNCLVLIKNSTANLVIESAEIKNFNGTQIIASREQTGSVTVKNTAIHDNALRAFTENLKGGNSEYYREEYATLIWVQKHDAVFENVTITGNTIDIGNEAYGLKYKLGNGILIFFRGMSGVTTELKAENLIIENNEASRHIFATYATYNSYSYTFTSGHIGDNTVDNPDNMIFVVGNLTVGEDMLVEGNIVLNNDGNKGVCTLTNNGTIIGDINATFAQNRGNPRYTGTGTHEGTLTGFTKE